MALTEDFRIQSGSCNLLQLTKLVITGQTSILMTLRIKAFVATTATSEYNVAENILAPTNLKIRNVIAGTRVTFQAFGESAMNETFTIQ